MFKVRVCGQDGERAPAERAEHRARSEWSLGVGVRGAVEWVCADEVGEAEFGAPELMWGAGGCAERRGGALATAGCLRGAFRGRVRASLAAAAAARTALRPPCRRSRGRRVLGGLLGHRHSYSSSP